MSEDTPDTEHVRAQFARMENFDPYYEGDLYLTPDGQLSAQKFDRWLAKHDAAVGARARSELLERQFGNLRLQVEANRKEGGNDE